MSSFTDKETSLSSSLSIEEQPSSVEYRTDSTAAKDWNSSLEASQLFISSIYTPFWMVTSTPSRLLCGCRLFSEAQLLVIAFFLIRLEKLKTSVMKSTAVCAAKGKVEAR